MLKLIENEVVNSEYVSVLMALEEKKQTSIEIAKIIGMNPRKTALKLRNLVQSGLAIAELTYIKDCETRYYFTISEKGKNVREGKIKAKLDHQPNFQLMPYITR